MGWGYMRSMESGLRSGIPKISAHVAAFNQEPFLAQALASLAACGFEDLEIIVFDDCSTDRTLEIAKAWRDRDARIRIIESPENVGYTKALAAMLAATESPYVLTLDADDVLLPGNLARQAAFLDANPSCAGVYGKMPRVDEGLNYLGSILGQPFSRFLLAYNNQIGHCGTLIRRSTALEAGGYFDLEEGRKFFCEDYFLWQRMAEKGFFHFEDLPVCLYRQREGQLSKANAGSFAHVCELMRRHCLGRNRDILEAIASGRPLSIAPEDFARTVLLLGALSKALPPESQDNGKLVDAAIALEPRDYGARLMRCEFLAARGRLDEAVSECLSIYSSWPGDFVKLRTAKTLSAFLERSGRKEEAASWAAQAAVHLRAFGSFPAPSFNP